MSIPFSRRYASIASQSVVTSGRVLTSAFQVTLGRSGGMVTMVLHPSTGHTTLHRSQPTQSDSRTLGCGLEARYGASAEGMAELAGSMQAPPAVGSMHVW